MISVLCPSRDRPQQLKRSVESLRTLARGEVEVLVAADDDDPVTVEAALEPYVADRLHVTPRLGYGKLHEYYQLLADEARGDWLLVWNDDCTMLTHAWDTVIETLPLNVLVADLQSPHSPLCCFPAVRRSAVDAIGAFSTASPHVDTFWQDVGRSLGVIRAVPVHASAESPVSTNSHGFYDGPHQAEMKALADKLRARMPL